ncbi:MAG: SpoIIIAH-like family protein [Clostridia bacterium]|nr:SpoIIIAH-like family protein [Clostridia bacterium]MBQ7910239.1 SpoIIIAH-like family protein [Clostridia bacterium]
MNQKNGFESVKRFFEKIGKRNLVIAGAVTLVIAAVAVNWIVFSGDDKKDGFDYDASAGMNTNYGTTLNTGEVGDTTSKPTGSEPDSTDSYFSSVEVSRKRARDEALEVLNAVVENDQASDAVKAEAMAEIQTIAKEMSQESNIESILMSKGFAQCLAVINGESANIVVRTEEQLNASQLAQINAVVYEQAGIEPVNITIVAKS